MSAILEDVTAVGPATLPRIATTAFVAVMLVLVLQASVWPASAAARDGRSSSKPAEDLGCLGLSARDIAALRDSADVRAELDKLCHTVATMKSSDDESRFARFPLWIVIVAAIATLALGIGLVWHYCIRQDRDVPWFWHGWGWWW